MNYSRQREAILDFVKRAKLRHPSADLIYAHIKKNFPKISLGTVYRNLNLLSENGAIRKIHTPSDSDRFDHNIEPHYHAVCRRCGKIEDIDTSLITLNADTILRESGFEVETDSILIKGLCADCRKKISKQTRKNNKEQ